MVKTGRKDLSGSKLYTRGDNLREVAAIVEDSSDIDDLLWFIDSVGDDVVGGVKKTNWSAVRGKANWATFREESEWFTFLEDFRNEFGGRGRIAEFLTNVGLDIL